MSLVEPISLTFLSYIVNLKIDLLQVTYYNILLFNQTQHLISKNLSNIKHQKKIIQLHQHNKIIKSLVHSCKFLPSVTITIYYIKSTITIITTYILLFLFVPINTIISLCFSVVLFLFPSPFINNLYAFFRTNFYRK